MLNGFRKFMCSLSRLSWPLALEAFLSPYTLLHVDICTRASLDFQGASENEVMVIDGHQKGHRVLKVKGGQCVLFNL